MAERSHEGQRRRGPRLFTIPAHRAFADTLVAGLIQARGGDDPMALARGVVLLPNNRAVRAVTDAFVRASGGALLLPRLVALGDPEAGEAAGAAIDPIGADPILPAVQPYRRRMALARMLTETGFDPAEGMRLACELGRTLDQMLVEEVAPHALRELDLGPELTEHWNRALATFSLVLDRWPRELAALGCIDAIERRGRLLDALADRWRVSPPAFVCAAGVTDPAPPVARLLRTVSEMPGGSVVFAGLDRAMPGEEWDALGPHRPDPTTGLTHRSIETHPQFHLKLILDRMGVARAEVDPWRVRKGEGHGDHDADPARSRAIANALAPADFTGRWTALPATERRLSGVTATEYATPAEEAQAIAIALRGALEQPGRTAALVTPDRALARRVATHLRRWDIRIDDSAGRPLAVLPPGTLLIALVEALAQDLAPPALLALLKHPLVRAGDLRLAWLDGVRAVDLQLRGPRPAPGMTGLDEHLGGRAKALWDEARPCLRHLCELFSSGPVALQPAMACLRETAQALCGDELWAGPAGRAAADLLDQLEREAPHGPATIGLDSFAPFLRTLLDEVAVRPARGSQHPRLAIYGLIEARLQTADLMVLGGLNEGVWPGNPPPDPWLAPRIRQALGLAGLERRIGIAAHDFAAGLGAPDVLLTRARRDAGGPTLASRLWLRLQAMAGDRFPRNPGIEHWPIALDDPGEHRPEPRPAPLPAPERRPRAISVTEVDRLKADPYAFYARRILRLSPLDPIDADASAAWRGTEVHRILEEWWQQDGCAVDRLRPRAEAMLADEKTHPMMRALWQPRLLEAIDWIAAEVAARAAAGRRVASAEGKGGIEIAGVTLSGRYDRIDRDEAGGVVVVDYKTGKPPSAAAVRAGFSLQLGLLGLIAERGGFDEVIGQATGFEYWSLGKKRGEFGYVETPVDPAGKRDKVPTSEFTGIAAANFVEVAGRWLTGTEPFTAKLHPEYAPYAEYDQLMRRDEWYGRD
jgi:ATP-dependent helicase/nuclease subunit B